MTDYLFAMPSFIAGMGRVIDLGATMNQYNTSNSPAEADARALYNDCLTVGNDMREVLKKYNHRG